MDCEFLDVSSMYDSKSNGVSHHNLHKHSNVKNSSFLSLTESRTGTNQGLDEGYFERTGSQVESREIPKQA